MQVEELKTEHLNEPLGIETTHPRFRWLLKSTERGQLQSAYQILVATSLEKLEAGTGDKWDSGRVTSDNFVEIPYAGRELASGERAYWKLRIWDRSGRPSTYSAPSFFEMALLRASDWQGKWIAAKQGISSPLLRREFSIDAPVRRARVYVSGLGYYELSINGQKIGDRVLEPASTYYHNDQPFKLGSRVLYSTYDVTDALKNGANAVGVMLGHGWYSAETDPSFRTPYGDRPRLILQMNVELANGRRFSVISDASWKTSAGPITYNDLAHGETYDARLDEPGWDAPDFNDASWENASLSEPPSGVLTAELMPPERVMETLPALRKIIPTEPDLEQFPETYIYDFGRNFTGWTRITVSGPRGARVMLRYATRIYPDSNTLDDRSNMPPVTRARQTDTYVLKGEGTEVWEPRFTAHGFRYVEVTSFRPAVFDPQGATVHKIEGRFVRSALDAAGSFVSSNDLLNRIHENIQWTLMSSFQGIPQDAADRAERVSWGAAGEEYIYNYDVESFWEKRLNDVRDSQREDGAVPWISPPHIRGTGIETMYEGGGGGYPIQVWNLYRYYGDRRVVEDHFENLKKLMTFLGRSTKDNLLGDSGGEHMEPQDDGHTMVYGRNTGYPISANAYYYYSAWLVAQMAEVLGRSRDAKHYLTLAQSIKKAFNSHFFNAATNQYGTGSQTFNALALCMDLVPPEKAPAVLKNLIDDIVNNHNTHVSTGVAGSSALVEVLPQRSAASLTYQLATQTTYPSLGDQVRRGATTVCETYECSAWTSQNMAMFTSLDKFLYRNLAGIYPASPGYQRVLIQPQPVGDLQYVKASQQTVRGNVTVNWTRGNASFHLKLSIPAGMEADIAVPTLDLKNVQITESGLTVWKSGVYVPGGVGLGGAKASGDSIIFHSGSGSYDFTMTGKAS